MKVGEVDERWIGLCMDKWWWELLWSRGEVGRRGEGGNTHGYLTLSTPCNLEQTESMSTWQLAQ